MYKPLFNSDNETMPLVFHLAPEARGDFLIIDKLQLAYI
jgi:hypothetical protein